MGRHDSNPQNDSEGSFAAWSRRMDGKAEPDTTERKGGDMDHLGCVVVAANLAWIGVIALVMWLDGTWEQATWTPELAEGIAFAIMLLGAVLICGLIGMADNERRR